jgi:hypothetical protein
MILLASKVRYPVPEEWQLILPTTIGCALCSASETEEQVYFSTLFSSNPTALFSSIKRIYNNIIYLINF